MCPGCMYRRRMNKRYSSSGMVTLSIPSICFIGSNLVRLAVSLILSSPPYRSKISLGPKRRWCGFSQVNRNKYSKFLLVTGTKEESTTSN